MNITIEAGKPELRHTTKRLLSRMLSPLCGLDQMIGFTIRAREEPRLVVAGAELTGVHVLRGQPAPKQGAYHVGGGGLVLEEALIRTLGETIERYAQMVAEVSGRHEIVMGTYDEIAAFGDRMLTPEQLAFFSPDQLARSEFPFESFSRDQPLGWVKLPSLVGDWDVWVPSQLVFVGYVVKRDAGERWLLPAVTTGSAAHTNVPRALLNGLLELVQIDAAMGHWFSGSVAPRIRLDERSRSLERLIARHFRCAGPEPAFYWLANPDLPGMSIACVMREKRRNIPAVAVGLGSDLSLNGAMYKALLEAVGVARLAKLVLMDEVIGEAPRRPADLDPRQLFDLDRNVAFYALTRYSERVNAKFVEDPCIDASDLPTDAESDVSDQIRMMVDGFRRSGKELLFCNLSSPEVRQLAFTALRVWSPDTLGLALPSAPPAVHPRFAAYGGFHNDAPHPYP